MTVLLAVVLALVLAGLNSLLKSVERIEGEVRRLRRALDKDAGPDGPR